MDFNWKREKSRHEKKEMTTGDNLMTTGDNLSDHHQHSLHRVEDHMMTLLVI